MSENTLSLPEIRAAIGRAPALKLDQQILGVKGFELLQRSFRGQTDFIVNQCTISEKPDDHLTDHLTVAGTFLHLFPWDNVNVTMSFIDYPGAETAKERGCLFCVALPYGYSIASYLNEYCFAVAEPKSSVDYAAIPKIKNYLQAIRFRESGRSLVFSSMDFTVPEGKQIFYPDSLKALFPSSQVKAGINCLVDVIPVQALEKYFGELLGASCFENDKGYGLIYPVEVDLGQYEPTFLLWNRMTLELKIGAFGPFSLKFTGTGIMFPLTRPAVTGPQIVFEGAVSIGSVEFSTRADYNAYYDSLAVSFYGFPTLENIIKHLANRERDEAFVNLISSVLNVKLSRLGVVLGLRDKWVSEISCSVTSQEDVKLIENIISLKPTLNMRIRAPFDSERSIEGELKGIWQLGKTNFYTALYYPGFAFRAGMASKELDVDEVVRSILGSIPVPKLNMKLTKMEVWGNFMNKSFSAEIDADYEWSFLLGSYAFGLGISKLLVTYDNRQVSCALDGKLKLAGVDVFILAQYDSELGWKLSGGTPVGKIVDFGVIAGKLLESLSLPATVPAKPPKLGLKNIIFSATPKRGEYSLGCEAAESWTLMDGVELKVDRFRAEKSQGLSVTGLLRVSLTIKDTVTLWLSAEKAAAAKGGWKFEGGSAEGQSIKIADIVNWIGEGNKFGSAPQLPDAVENFTIDKLKLSLESEKKDFFFTCEGKVRLPELADPIQGIITIDIKHQEDKSFTKLFGGSLIIDGMEFDLIFESSDKASTFVAAYHDDKGHTIKIDDLTKRVFKSVFAGEAPTTGLEISLRDALFAYQKTGQQGKYLFGLDIEGGLNLSELNLPNLPLIGQAFPSGETLKLALQVLAAGDTFTAAEIDGLNKLKGKGISLPQQELNKGLKLAALLRVGQETKPLSLPIGLGKGNGQGTGLVEDKTVSVTPTNQLAVYPSSADGTKWINIQKTFGPIHVERVGVGYQTGTGNIALLLDAALTAAGLTLSLDGLGAEFALKDLAKKEFKPTFHLNGLGIDYRSGSVEIGGSFLEQKVTQTVDGKKLEYTSYAGLAVIRTQKLTLSAIGSYAQINGRDPSLFIYAVANYPLGGPAFFYVTGFAAGFGYNRALTLPSIDEIASFPLVAEAVSGPASLPSSQKEQQKTLTNKLQQLERYLPPSVGDIFIAAGIKFTSFKQIDSFALLVVKFGRRFEIHLLGLSTLTAPPPQAAKPGEKTVAPIAEAQLVLKASFIPDEGFLGVRAQLTPNSYILSKDCHLNGGFAFYTWFEPHPHAGDFVLTLGGYHPKFIVPDHYPQVPRLALNWQVSPELHIKADAYFALTGSAIMAGGHLQATWESGDLRAWFVAGADFLLAWKPFHYDLELYIGIGVSYTFKALGNQTLSVDLGANLHLWGPEFSGTATIHWSIISFTVNFGEGAPQHLEKLDWNTFKTSFLPKPEQICSIAVQQGLIRQMKEDGQSERWIVNPKEMVLVINSAIPLNKLKAGQMKLAEEDLEERAKHLAIAPMGIESGGLTSTCEISIKRDDKEVEDAFQVRPIWKSMPAGLWGKPNLTEDKNYLKPPNLNGAQLVENLLAGFEIRPRKKDQKAHMCQIDREKLQYTTELVRCDYGWRDLPKLSTPQAQGQSAWKAAKTVAGKREELDKLVKALGLVNAEIDFGEPVDQGVLLAA